MSEKMSAEELAEVAKILDADINTSAKRLFGRLLAHISALQREADGLREALEALTLSAAELLRVIDDLKERRDFCHWQTIHCDDLAADVSAARAALSPPAEAEKGSDL